MAKKKTIKKTFVKDMKEEEKIKFFQKLANINRGKKHEKKK